MTTHPEDAMTRERARVRHVKRGSTYRIIGKAQVQCEKDDPLTDYEVVVVYQCEQDGEIWVRRVSEFDDGRFEKLPVLASAQQEPAPVADVEEASRIWFAGCVSFPTTQSREAFRAGWLAHEATALRRYAGDGGMTWQPISTAPRDGSIILIDSKPDEPTWLPFVARLIEGPYPFPPGTVWTRAPARKFQFSTEATAGTPPSRINPKVPVHPLELEPNGKAS